MIAFASGVSFQQILVCEQVQNPFLLMRNVLHFVRQPIRNQPKWADGPRLYTNLLVEVLAGMLSHTLLDLHDGVAAPPHLPECRAAGFLVIPWLIVIESRINRKANRATNWVSHPP